MASMRTDLLSIAVAGALPFKRMTDADFYVDWRANQHMTEVWPTTSEEPPTEWYLPWGEPI